LIARLSGWHKQRREMNILTPTEISECLTGGPTTVARAIESEVIAKLAAAEPVNDLRGIDAGPVSEWVDLVRRGYVKKDECLIAVKDIPKWVEQNTPPAMQAEPVIPAGFALVPIRATAAMVEAFYEEGWEWANVLAAAEAVTEGEYEAALEGTPPATQADNWNEVEAYQAALTAALGALKRLAKRDGWKPFVTEDANDQWKPAEQDGLDAIAQLEALGE